MAGYAQELVLKLTVDNGQITAALGDTKRSLDQVDGAGKKANKGFGRLTRTMKQMAASFVIYKVINLMTQAFVESIKSVAAFELAMNRVKAISGASAEEFEKLTNSAQELAIGTMFTATQVAELQLAYSKLGFTTPEILAAAEATLQLATVTGDDLAGAADVVGATIRGFNLSAEETDRVVDVMGASFTSTALNIDHFKQSMKTLAPIAVSANIDLETTTALLGVLANQGLRGTRAATGLKNIMSALTDPTSELAKKLGYTITSAEGLFKAFRQLGQEGIDLAAATGLIDERAKPAFITLANGIGTVEELTETFNTANGVIAEQAAIVDESLSIKWDKFFAALDVTINKKFGRTIKDFGKILDFFTKHMSDAAEGLGESGNMIEVIKELNDAIGNTGPVLSLSEIPLVKFNTVLAKNKESIKQVSEQLKLNKKNFKEAAGAVQKGSRGYEILSGHVANYLDVKKEELNFEDMSLAKRYEILEATGVWIDEQGKLRSSAGAFTDQILENVFSLEDLLIKYKDVNKQIKQNKEVRDDEIENDRTKVKGLQNEIRHLKLYQAQLEKTGQTDVESKRELIRLEKLLKEVIGDGTKERPLTPEEIRANQRKIDEANRLYDQKLQAEMDYNIQHAKNQEDEIKRDNDLVQVYKDNAKTVLKFRTKTNEQKKALAEKWNADATRLATDLAEDILENAKDLNNKEIKLLMKTNIHKAKQVKDQDARDQAMIDALRHNQILLFRIEGMSQKEREEQFEKFQTQITEIQRKGEERRQKSTDKDGKTTKKKEELLAQEILQAKMGVLSETSAFLNSINDLYQDMYDRRLSIVESANTREMESFVNNQNIISDKFAADQKEQIDLFRGTAEEKAAFEKMKAYEKIEFEQQQEEKRKAFREKQLKLENKIGEEAFKSNKKNTLAQIAINTALGIMQINANSTVNKDPTLVTLRSIMMGLITASGIAQAAAVSSQKFTPQTYAKGGLLVGDSHQQGGIPFTIGGRSGFEAEGGEFMFSKKAVDSLGVGFLNSLNNKATEFKEGGLVSQKINALAARPSSATYYVQSGGGMGANMDILKQFVSVTDSRFSELESIMANIKVTNVATETSAVSASVVNAKSHATF